MADIKVGIVVSDNGSTKTLADFNTKMTAVGKTTTESTKATKQFGDASAKATKDVGGLNGAMAKLGSSKVGAGLKDSFSGIAQSASMGKAGVADLGGSLISLVSKLGPVGIGIAAVVGTLSVGIKKFIDSASAIRDQADALGMTTDEVQFYDNVLKTAGGSMEKFQGALMNLSAKIESNDKSITNLGVATQDASGASRDQVAVLKDVMFALAKEEDATKRVAQSKAVLGKQSKAINILVSEGTAGLQKYFDEQEKYIAMNVASVNTADAVGKSFEAINLSFTKWSNSILAFPVSALARIMAGNNKQLVDQLDNNEKIIQATDRLTQARQNLSDAEAGIARNNGNMETYRDHLDQANKSIALETKLIADLTGETEKLADAQLNIVKQAEQSVQNTKDLNIETGLLRGESWALYAQENERYKKAITGLGNETELLAQKNKHLAISAQITKKIKDEEKARAVQNINDLNSFMSTMNSMMNKSEKEKYDAIQAKLKSDYEAFKLTPAYKINSEASDAAFNKASEDLASNYKNSLRTALYNAEIQMAQDTPTSQFKGMMEKLIQSRFDVLNNEIVKQSTSSQGLINSSRISENFPKSMDDLLNNILIPLAAGIEISPEIRVAQLDRIKKITDDYKNIIKIAFMNNIPLTSEDIPDVTPQELEYFNRILKQQQGVFAYESARIKSTFESNIAEQYFELGKYIQDGSIDAFANGILSKDFKVTINESGEEWYTFIGKDTRSKFKKGLDKSIEGINKEALSAKNDLNNIVQTTFEMGGLDVRNPLYIAAKKNAAVESLNIEADRMQKEIQLYSDAYVAQVSMYENYAATIISSAMKISEVKSQNVMKDIELQKTAELESLNNSTMTNRRRAQMTAEINKKAEDAKRVQFEKDKRRSIAQALINGALGVTNAWANGGTWQSNIVESGVVTAATAIEVAAISMQNFKNSGVVGGFEGSSAGMDNSIVSARKGEMFLNTQDQKTLFNGIKSGNLGGGKGSVVIQQGNIVVQGGANQSAIDQIKAETQRFSSLVKETVLDLQYRRQLSFA